MNSLRRKNRSSRPSLLSYSPSGEGFAGESVPQTPQHGYYNNQAYHEHPQLRQQLSYRHQMPQPVTYQYNNAGAYYSGDFSNLPPPHQLKYTRPRESIDFNNMNENNVNLRYSRKHVAKKSRYEAPMDNHINADNENEYENIMSVKRYTESQLKKSEISNKRSRSQPKRSLRDRTNLPMPRSHSSGVNPYTINQAPTHQKSYEQRNYVNPDVNYHIQPIPQQQQQQTTMYDESPRESPRRKKKSLSSLFTRQPSIRNSLTSTPSGSIKNDQSRIGGNFGGMTPPQTISGLQVGTGGINNVVPVKVSTKTMGGVMKRRKQVVLLGLDGAGKTTILMHLKYKCFMATTPTVGFNHEKVWSGGFRWAVWDVGGGERIRGLWATYSRGADCVVFVVDSGASEENMEEARLELARVMKVTRITAFQAKKTAPPLLVMANFQDRQGARSAEGVAKGLQLGLEGAGSVAERWAVACVCGVTGEGIDEAMRTLRLLIDRGNQASKNKNRPNNSVKNLF